MIGTVDEKSRALLDVPIGKEPEGDRQPVTVWRDTAFDGHLVFPRKLIATLNLDLLVETDAIFADGSKVTLETFVCYVEWFGSRLPLQVIANEAVSLIRNGTTRRPRAAYR